MKYAIEMLNIRKEFSGIVANDNVTLQLEKGEIHALLGENGAGKSTLMSVLFGLYQPEAGVIKIAGKEVKINNPNDANNLAIGMVHQHFKLVHNFTVLENICLGIEESKFGLLKVDNSRKKIMELSDKYHLSIDPDALIQDITVGMQQRVEILKMLYRNNDILIFDEPTAVLTSQEISELMKIMKQLTEEGKSIIFITHKLDEIKEVANRCTILRKGKGIKTVDVSATSKEQLSEMMVGRHVDLHVEKNNSETGETVLEVKNLIVKSNTSLKNSVNNINFTVKKGEIVCIAGIDGNGQSELIYSITGLSPLHSGEILLNGKDISGLSIRKRTTSGIGHIPEDRHKHGLVLDYSLAENTILQSYFSPQFQKNNILKFGEINDYSNKLIENFDIRSGEGSKTTVRSMSGGNQQKIILAREIDRNPDLLIAVQPTRGLDIGAIEYVHKQIVAQRNAGKAVLLVSLELEEVMNISDRILVMYEGELVGNLNPKEIDVKELGLYMAGAKKGEV